MAFIALRKLNLQTRMRSNPLGLHVWYFWSDPSSTIIPYVCANTEVSGETARMLFAVRLCDKYHNLMSWLN